MKVRIILQTVVGLCAMFCLGASAQEYVTLVAKAGSSSEKEVLSGQVATVMHLRSSGPPAPGNVPLPVATSGYLQVLVNEIAITYTVADLILGRGNSSTNAAASNLPIIVGPAKLQLKSGINGSALCTVRIDNVGP